jgi:hypothetical protein
MGFSTVKFIIDGFDFHPRLVIQEIERAGYLRGNFFGKKYSERS